MKAKIGNTYLNGVGTTKDFVTDLDDNIYLTGQYFGYYGGSEMDFYVEKYDSSLVYRWNKVIISGGGEYSYGIGIDPSGCSYIVGCSEIQNFIGLEMGSSMPISVGVAKLNTNSGIRLRPYRPTIKRLTMICEGEKIEDLYAKGVNVKWYHDPYKKEFVHEGNSYKPAIDRTDTFYVTQTIGNVESWPKEVIVHFSELPNAKLTIKNDTIFATKGTYFKYQWFYPGDTIKNAVNNYIVPDTMGNYSVMISEGKCQKILDTTYITNTLVKNLTEVSSILYPNPTKGKVTLIVKNDHVGKIKIQVTTLKGDVIFHKEFDDVDSYLIEFIDLSSYPLGIYLIAISGNNINKSMKVLRE